MIIEILQILPPEGEVKHLGQFISFNNATHVELITASNVHGQHSRATGRILLRDRFKLFDATVTPPFLNASCAWKMPEKQEIPERKRRRRTPDSQLEDATTVPNSKTLPSTTQTATPPSTKFQVTILKTCWNHGLTTWCAQSR